jgi:hypothetical protein
MVFFRIHPNKQGITNNTPPQKKKQQNKTKQTKKKNAGREVNLSPKNRNIGPFYQKYRNK